MKYIVYVTTNDYNERVYIGVHGIEHEDIFDGYLGCGVYKHKVSSFMYPKSPMQIDVKKYGVEAFHRHTLFTYDNPDDAYKKLEQIIDANYLDSYTSYNICSAWIHSQPINQFDLKGRFLRTWNSVDEVADFYNYDANHFDLAVISKTKLLDSFWTYNEKKIKYHDFWNGHVQYIYAYSLEGKCLYFYESQEMAAEQLQVSVETIKEAILKQIPVGKYYITNKLVAEFNPKPRRQFAKSIIHVWNADKEYLGAYKGKAVMKVIGTHSWQKISNAVHLMNGWYRDFYINTEKIDEVPDKVKKIPLIEVYTRTGEYIETVEGLKALKEKYHMTSSEANKIMKGNKYHEQYIFKYSK